MFHYRFSCLWSKQAVLILLWNVVIGFGPGLLQFLGVHGGMYLSFLPKHYLIGLAVGSMIYVLIFLLYPLAGFLGDMYCGRSRIILVSLMLIVAALCMVFVVCEVFVFMGFRVNNILLETKSLVPFGIIVVVAYIGLAGFQANVLQFAVDQLQDAPSGQVSAMIRWYFWCFGISYSVATSVIFWLTICSNNYLAQLVLIWVGVVFGCALVLFRVTHNAHRSVVDINIQSHKNPYKMVCAILSFARKHSHPLRRSSLLYWSDESASRIDFAKEKYGGPFSSEEVEDVKTFFRMLLIIVAMGVYFLAQVPAGVSLSALLFHIDSQDMKHQYSHCTEHNPAIIREFATVLLIVLMALIFEFIVHPLMSAVFPKALNSYAIGLLLLVANIIMNLIVDAIKHATYKQGEIECMFTFNESNSTFEWQLNLGISISGVLNFMAFMLTSVSGLQFIVAQAPHSMKGILIGLYYFSAGLFTMLGAFLVLPFYFPFQNTTTRLVNCGFDYYLTNTVIAAVGLLVYVAVVRGYKYRQRYSFNAVSQLSFGYYTI